MRIADGVEAFKIPIEVLGKRQEAYPVLIWDHQHAVLVDTGYPGQMHEIRKAMEDAGVEFDRLDKVILTHHDLDHIGGLSELVKELSGKIEVLAHEKEKAYIQGEKRPLKLEFMEAKLETLPVEMKGLYEKMKASFEKSKAPVSRTVTDGEVLPFCGGITIIYTPGHTLGHISLYLNQSKILITGDALNVENGLLVPAPKFANYDNTEAGKSLEKFALYDIEKIICYHGGLFKDNVKQKLKEIILTSS